MKDWNCQSTNFVFVIVVFRLQTQIITHSFSENATRDNISKKKRAPLLGQPKSIYYLASIFFVRDRYSITMSLVRYLQEVMLVSQLNFSTLAQTVVNFQNFKFIVNEDVVYNHILQGHVFQRLTVGSATQARALEHFTSLMSVISLYDDKQVSWLISFLRECCVCRMVNSASIMKKEKVFISILFWLLICFSYSEGKDSLYFEFARVLLVRVHFSGATAFFFCISAIKRFSV